MLSIILPTFLTSLYVGSNMSARLGGGNAVVLPQILYSTDVFHSIVTKGKGGIIVVAGWLTRIPWWTLLLAWSAINVWQAAQLELINDEAYYWMFSRFPDWGYFDHPPMVGRWRTRGPARERDLLGPGRMAVCPACPTSACHGCGALVRAAPLEFVQ